MTGPRLPMQRCRLCGTAKLTTDFYRRSRNGPLRTECIDCYSKQQYTRAAAPRPPHRAATARESRRTRERRIAQQDNTAIAATLTATLTTTQGLTLSQLSAATGLSRTTLRQWQAGKRAYAKADTVARLSAVYVQYA